MSTEVTYDLDELELAVNKWIDTIEEILKKPLPKLDCSLDAIHVTGYDYDTLISKITEGIEQHMASKEDHMLFLTDLFLNSKLIIEQEPVVTINDNQIQVRNLVYVEMGLRASPASLNLNLLSTDTQYLILKSTVSTTGSNKVLNSTMYLSDVGVESYLTHTIATIHKPSGTVHNSPTWIGEEDV